MAGACTCIYGEVFSFKIIVYVIVQDEHLMNHIVRNNLLKPIIEAFVSNGDRYNLLNSVVLELFEYIRAVILSLKPLMYLLLNCYIREG